MPQSDVRNSSNSNEKLQNSKCKNSHLSESNDKTRENSDRHTKFFFPCGGQGFCKRIGNQSKKIGFVQWLPSLCECRRCLPPRDSIFFIENTVASRQTCGVPWHFNGGNVASLHDLVDYTNEFGLPLHLHIEDQTNSVFRGTAGLEEQWVQRTRGTITIEDQRYTWKRGIVGLENQR